MKKYTSLRKGFTLVELMIVIAIIGILAAVLYPGFNGFMEGARDSARQTTLKNYSTALLAYNQDNSEFPKTKAAANTGTAETMCINDLFENHLKKHMSKGVEKDPKPGNGVDIGGVNCAGKTEGGYGYKPLKLGGETDANGNAYALAAKMEKWSNANFDGSTIGNLQERDKFTALTKGTDELKALKDDSSKTYYVVVN